MMTAAAHTSIASITMSIVELLEVAAFAGAAAGAGVGAATGAMVATLSCSDAFS